MGRIYVKREQEVPWADSNARHITNGRSAVRNKIMGDEETGPWVRVVDYAPGYEFEPHSHDQDEVIYVLQGDAEVGGENYGPGTVIYIEKNTPYGPLKAGPEGFRFVLVRPGRTSGAVYQTKPS